MASEKKVTVKRECWGANIVLFDAFIGDSLLRAVSGCVNHGERTVSLGNTVTVEAARDYALAIIAVCDAVEKEPRA